MDSSRTKTCNTCEEEKSYTEFGKQASNKDGYLHICRDCRSIYNRKLNERNAQKVKILNPSGFKECTTCKTEKSYKIFSLRPDTKDGYYPICKECVNNKAMIRRLQNVEVNKEREINPLETKYCSGCDSVSSKANFIKNVHSADGINSKCKDCTNKHRRDNYDRLGKVYYERTKQRFIHNKRLQDYGLKLVDYENLMRLQSGCCAICKTNTETLVVDHCHICGNGDIKAVRGLLCSICNSHSSFSLDYPNGLLVKAREYALVHWNEYHRKENLVGKYTYGQVK